MTIPEEPELRPRGPRRDNASPAPFFAWASPRTTWHSPTRIGHSQLLKAEKFTRQTRRQSPRLWRNRTHTPRVAPTKISEKSKRPKRSSTPPSIHPSTYYSSSNRPSLLASPTPRLTERRPRRRLLLLRPSSSPSSALLTLRLLFPDKPVLQQRPRTRPVKVVDLERLFQEVIRLGRDVVGHGRADRGANLRRAEKRWSDASKGGVSDRGGCLLTRKIACI